MDITAVINTYRRPHRLEEQYNAIKNQTIKPAKIMIWSNSPDVGFTGLTKEHSESTSVLNNRNHGVWARFAFALLAKTKYVCVFDDDTIPGTKWFENCLNTIRVSRGLLGTIGIVFNTKEKYIGNCVRVGWDRPNEVTKRVDFVGHCWFFERDWLNTFWGTAPDVSLYPCCSEDVHFSYSLQKFLGIHTYVPPHPVNDTEMWGSKRGMEYGSDSVSIWMNNSGNAVEKVESYIQSCFSNGWEIVNG